MSVKKAVTDLSHANDTDLITAVRRYLVQDRAVPATLKQVAADFGVTPHRLTAAFQNNLGVSFAVYVRRERLRAAQRLLLQTSMPIQVIADELGFSCSANFASAFREFMGMTPSEYRRDPQAHRDLTTGDVKWGQGPV